MRMTILQLFLILFPFEYLKELLIPQKNKIMKHPIYLGELIWWIGCWFYMGFWVGIYNRRKWWFTTEPNMSEVAPFRINNYM